MCWAIQTLIQGEFNDCSEHKVIDLMPDQHGDIPKGGTMRLGAYPCSICKGSLLEQIYGTDLISERHRHRYEFSNEYREEVTERRHADSGNVS